MPQNDDFVLTVIAGPNAGASAALRAGRSVLGGGRDDDIVLDGVGPAALSLTLDGNRARLAPAGGDVSVGESLSSGAAIPAGTAQIVTLPTVMRIGQDTIVSLARRRPESRGQMRLGIAAGLAALALVGGTTLGMQLSGSTPDPNLQQDSTAVASSESTAAEEAVRAGATRAEVARTQVLPDKVTVADVPPPPPPPPSEAAVNQPVTAPGTGVTGLIATSPRIGPCQGACLVQAAAGLRAGLEAGGLSGITVEPADGVLKVAGSLPASQMADWERLRTRFEAEFGQSLPLIVSMNNAADAPALAVASVWLGAMPEIRTKNGQILRVGDATPDGWTIRSIGKGQIALARGDREVTVNF